MRHGLNFFGSSETSDGIGRAAALNIECLKATQLPLDVFVLSRPVARQTGKDTIIDEALLSTLESKINIFHFSARWATHYFSRLGEGSLRGFYNIGYWVCEVPKIPDIWARQFEFFDEIWTASAFCQTALARSANIPVIRIPHMIQPRSISQRIRDRQQGVPFESFNFLFIFNSYSDSERKNVLFLIRAFINAFGSDLSVRLIVKVSNIEYDPDLLQKLNVIRNFHKNIEIIEGYVSDTALQSLYDQADAYVSLHRAEGFGLTISDAMSRGIPVITTGYSGNMEFCRADDTRLVAYTLRKVGHERLRYRKDDIWAEPDLADATAALREIVMEYPVWLRKADSARNRIAADFSVQSIAALMHERIGLIKSNFIFTSDMANRVVDKEVAVFETYGF